ncbi:MAG TPA: helix-turn-helix domain-containing protein [Gammaproteobacteria bacterium]
MDIQDNTAGSGAAGLMAQSTSRHGAPLGSRLRSARKVKGWSQQDLANRAGTTQAVIQKIENGKSLRPRNIEAIADALDVEAAWLMFGTGESAPLSKEAIEVARVWSELSESDRKAVRETILRLAKRN